MAFYLFLGHHSLFTPHTTPSRRIGLEYVTLHSQSYMISRFVHLFLSLEILFADFYPTCISSTPAVFHLTQSCRISVAASIRMQSKLDFTQILVHPSALHDTHVSTFARCVRVAEAAERWRDLLPSWSQPRANRSVLLTMVSRTTKISILLALTSCLFVVELTVGYVVGSLALIADAYHMLNDAMSMCIALYAVRVAKRSADSKYSYGWHRAEVIAALINGVFLLALCFSIIMESLERFAHVPEIKDPRLVVIVGSVGLGCNIFGIFLFHDHGHDHGNGGHIHANLPETKATLSPGVTEPVTSSIPGSPIAPVRRSNSIHSLYGHPAQNRMALQQAAQQSYYEMTLARSHDDALDTEERGGDGIVVRQAESGDERRGITPPRLSSSHGHQHVQPRKDGALNIRGVLLHVIGDALGSVGVIISGLIIWLTKSKKRFYADPTLSLIITILIICSAVPLVRSAGYILLQGVPSDISLTDVRRDIRSVDGVESVHELHVWQLSEARLIASVHIKVSPTRPYMDIVRDVKSMLHQAGIHSGTVQPEFADDGSDTKCEVTCPPNTCGVKQTCCPLEPIKET